jgi:heme/copper-type cytochrome/quinol oxidase subunit 2
MTNLINFKAAAKKGYSSMANIWLYVVVGAGVIGFVVLVLLIFSIRKRNNSKKGQYTLWYPTVNNN